MQKKILSIVSALLGLMLLNSGFNKFLWYMPQPEMTEAAGNLFMAFKESIWMLPLIAVVEIIGGVLLVLPKTRALGAIVVLPIVVGIVLFHIVQDTAALPLAIVLFGINLWVILDSKDKYLPMIK